MIMGHRSLRKSAPAKPSRAQWRCSQSPGRQTRWLAELILKTEVLFFSSDTGDAKVSFTRSPEVAAYWALLERDLFRR